MDMDDFSKYESMRDKGALPPDVYLAAKADGLDSITVLRLLRKVFSFSLLQAKEVMVTAQGLANSLEEHQEKLASSVEEALAQLEDGRIANGAASESERSAHADRSEDASTRKAL